MTLSATAKVNICTVLAALVNAGGVRPEDQSDVQTALGALQSELTADETAIAHVKADISDLQDRVAALEDLDNGEELAIEPPAAPTPVPTAVLSTDPAHSQDGAAQTLITSDAEGLVLSTPVVSGVLDPSTTPVTVDPITGTPAIGVPTVASDADPVIVGDTVPAPAGTPAPDDPAHVDADTSTVVATADPEPVA